MRIRNYIFIVLLVCFGCKNTAEKQAKKTSVQNATIAANFSFVDSVQII